MRKYAILTKDEYEEVHTKEFENEFRAADYMANYLLNLTDTPIRPVDILLTNIIHSSFMLKEYKPGTYNIFGVFVIVVVEEKPEPAAIESAANKQNW